MSSDKHLNHLNFKQFSSGFVDINPNSKIPALLDRRAGANDQRVFESGSILLYLSEAFDGAFLPKGARCKMNSLKPNNTVLFDRNRRGGRRP